VGRRARDVARGAFAALPERGSRRRVPPDRGARVRRVPAPEARRAASCSRSCPRDFRRCWDAARGICGIAAEAFGVAGRPSRRDQVSRNRCARRLAPRERERRRRGWRRRGRAACRRAARGATRPRVPEPAPATGRSEVEWSSAGAEDEFGSCATEVSEPRQVRKEAAIRRCLRAPQGCLNSSSASAPLRPRLSCAG